MVKAPVAINVHRHRAIAAQVRRIKYAPLNPKNIAAVSHQNSYRDTFDPKKMPAAKANAAQSKGCRVWRLRFDAEGVLREGFTESVLWVKELT